jgi:C1A family cysteine protease
MSYQRPSADANDLSLILSDSQDNTNHGSNKLIRFLVGITISIIVSVPLVMTYVTPGLGELVSGSVEKTFGNKFSYAEEDAELLSTKTEFEKSQLFEEFKRRHSKKYLTEEEELNRFSIFKNNIMKIDVLNSNQPLARYDITRFADLTDEEFASINGVTGSKEYKLMMKEQIEQAKSKEGKEKAHLIGYVPYDEVKLNLVSESNLPESFDWRQKGVVTGVKNQGLCGACWAFAGAGDMEGTWALKTGNLISLSEQYLTSCDIKDDGCEGGMMSNAYQWVITNGGTESEEAYPFISGADGEQGVCKAISAALPVTISGWTLVEAKTAEEMKAMLITHGPIAVAINASQMQFYSSGIDIPGVCLWSDVNHGVLLVGYGNEKGHDYWIVKNSWGSDWGEQGYYRISTLNGACGINELPIKSLA